MEKKELVKRYALCVISLLIAALGVAITKKGALGVSPISSVANVMSIKFPVLSLGYWLIIWNCVLILGQILVLRKNFKLIQLLQLPLSFLFGVFTDFGTWIFSSVPIEGYFSRIVCILVGTGVLALGVALSVMANVIMNSGEAFVMAVSDVTHAQFGNVKIIFDISCVFVAIILSLLFFDGKIVETREGTVIAALLTGFLVKICIRYMGKSIDNILKK